MIHTISLIISIIAGIVLIIVDIKEIKAYKIRVLFEITVLDRLKKIEDRLNKLEKKKKSDE